MALNPQLDRRNASGAAREIQLQPGEYKLTLCFFQLGSRSNPRLHSSLCAATSLIPIFERLTLTQDGPSKARAIKTYPAFCYCARCVSIARSLSLFVNDVQTIGTLVLRCPKSRVDRSYLHYTSHQATLRKLSQKCKMHHFNCPCRTLHPTLASAVLKVFTTSTAG